MRISVVHERIARRTDAAIELLLRGRYGRPIYRLKERLGTRW